MKKGDWDSPDTWCVLRVSGLTFMITNEVRGEVESWLRGLKATEDLLSTYTVDCVDGETVTIVANWVECIYDTTPETRFKTRAMGQFTIDEALDQGFSDAEE